MNNEPTNEPAAAAGATGDSEATAAKSGSVLGRAADKLVNGQGVFTLIRAGLTSQLSSWTDMAASFIFYAWVFFPLGRDPLRSFLATAIGLVLGGIVNSVVNYKFTFRSEHCAIKAVAVKFFLIWAGSFLLNLGGTTGLDHVLQKTEAILRVGWIKPDGIFAFARLSVSLVVSIFWNFLLQKNFVYRSTSFDPYAIRFVDWITLRGRRR
ncbi:MAG: GtrA family protein [Muribaculaceae bacterium]|nr:GtrA family protein [Muribaculaceae bacterium]